MNKLSETCKPAYVTVEAAFVIPLILGIVFSLLYIAFIEHDRAWLMIEMDGMLEHECRSCANGNESWNGVSAESSLCELSAKHLLIYKVRTVSSSNNGTYAEVEVKMELQITNVLVNRLTRLKTAYVLKRSELISDYCSAKRMLKVLK